MDYIRLRRREVARIAQPARHRARRRHRRRDQVDISLRTHAACEVAVGGRRRDLTGLGDTRTVSDAGTTARLGDHAPLGPEHRQDALGFSGVVDVLAGGGDGHAHTVGDLPVGQHASEGAQVRQGTTSAGPDDHVVDGNEVRRRFLEGLPVAAVTRGGDGQRDLGEIEIEDALVGSIVVRVDEHFLDDFARQATLVHQEGDDRFARLDHAGHQAAFDRHVGEHAQLVDRERVECGPPDLDHTGVRRASPPQLLAEIRHADDVEDDVLGGQVLVSLPVEHHPHHLRHRHGDKTRPEGERHGRGPNPKREGVEHAGGGGVGVGHDGDRSRIDVPLHRDAVTDTRLELAPRAVDGDVVLPTRRDHLRGERLRVGEAGRLDGLGDGGLVDEHEVVFEGADELRIRDRSIAVPITVERDNHPGRVLVYTPEAGAAEHLVTGLDAVHPEDELIAVATGPGVAGDQLLHHVLAGGVPGLSVVPGGQRTVEHLRAEGE